MGYRSLAARLRWEIKEEGYRPGQRLPPYTALAERHQTTSTTVSRAMRLLAREGLVDIVQGRGVYIVGTRDDRPRDLVENHLLDVADKARPGDPMPGVRALAEQHDTSAGTVRSVLSALYQRGVLRRTRAGKYVRA